MEILSNLLVLFPAVLSSLSTLKRKNQALNLIVSVVVPSASLLKTPQRRTVFTAEVANYHRQGLVDGVEIDIQWESTKDEAKAKEFIVKTVKVSAISSHTKQWGVLEIIVQTLGGGLIIYFKRRKSPCN